MRLKLAPKLFDVFGAVVHPVIVREHFLVVVVGSSLVI